MDINLSISPAPSITTNYLVVAAYKAASPGVLVASHVYAAPHTASQNLTFSGLSPEVHIIIVYENPVAAPGGTIRHQFIYDPSYQNALVRADLYLTVGSSAGLVPGATSYVNASLIGWNIDIERRSFGTMFSGDDYTYDNTIGKIDLTGVGDAFQNGEKFIIRFQPQITTASPVVQVSGQFTTVEIITGDIVLTAADMEKLQSIQGAGDHLTITLPRLSDIPDFKMLPFTSEGGNHINATLITQGLDTIRYLKGTPQSIIMGQSEELWLFKANGTYNVSYSQGNFKTVGEIVMSYLMTEENTMFCDGRILSRATYPRLWAFAQSLDASMLVSDSNWNNVALNLKGMFSTGDGSTTFRIPLLHTPGYLRGVDGAARKAGSFGDQSIQLHGHRVGTTGDQSSVDPGRSLQRSSRGQDPYGTQGTGIDAQGPFIEPTGGTETTPKNVGIYFLIRY